LGVRVRFFSAENRPKKSEIFSLGIVISQIPKNSFSLILRLLLRFTVWA
jgi:hypothetical protein